MSRPPGTGRCSHVPHRACVGAWFTLGGTYPPALISTVALVLLRAPLCVGTHRHVIAAAHATTVVTHVICVYRRMCVRSTCPSHACFFSVWGGQMLVGPVVAQFVDLCRRLLVVFFIDNAILLLLQQRLRRTPLRPPPAIRVRRRQLDTAVDRVRGPVAARGQRCAVCTGVGTRSSINRIVPCIWHPSGLGPH